MTVERRQPNIIAEALVPHETEFWVPSANLRPHHAFKSYTQAVLLGNADPEQLAKRLTADLMILQGQGDPTGYLFDVLSDNPTDEETHVERLTEHFQNLSALPDESYIHIDLAKDGMCKACIFGNHCMATNVIAGRTIKDLRKTIQREKDAINQITMDLHTAGYLEDEAYTRVETNHTFFNYVGERLNNGRKGMAVAVTFNSMIVRTEALRDIVAKGLMENY